MSWEFNNSAGFLSSFRPYDQIENKAILDVGCGLGGKSTYCALNGAREVVGIDLDPMRIEAAQGFAAQRGARNTQFRVSDSTCLPFPDGAFDLVLFNDSFEHLESPEAVLRECCRVVAPGGSLNLAFPPYGSPWGAHLAGYISLPWAQYLFEEKVLVEVCRREFLRRTERHPLFCSDERLAAIREARTICEFAQLSKMTVEAFERIVAGLPLRIELLHFLTPLGSARIGAGSRFLREHLATRVTAVLKRI